MKSPDTATLIPVLPPFDLRLTVGALRRLPSAALYPMIDGELRLVADLPAGPRLLGVRVTRVAVEGGDEGALAVRALDGPLSAEQISAAAAMLARMLGVRLDLAPLRARLAGEPALVDLARQLAGLKPPQFATLWQTFLQVVPFQQVSLSAAVTMLNRLVVALGPEIECEGRSYWGAPSPERLLAAETNVLRATGLSAAKIRTLRGLAERALAGELEFERFAELTDGAAIVRLTDLPGIGPWSAQVALLRGLGRLTVFPSGDAGASRGLRELLADAAQPEDEAPALLERLAEWRGYLYFLLLGKRLLALDANF